EHLVPTPVTDVLVIGAGAAGMAAAGRVAAGGRSVRVLEARDRIGGRIFSQHDPASPVAAELGAEYIQGFLPRSLELAREASAVVVEANGSSSRWCGSRLEAMDHPRRTTAVAFERLDSFRGRDRPLRRFLDELV